MKILRHPLLEEEDRFCLVQARLSSESPTPSPQAIYSR